MTKDLRHALRLIRSNLGFSFAVIAVMAFSIGACTAIFSVGKAVLFTRLPYSSSDRMILFWHTAAGSGNGVVGMSPHDYTIYRDTAGSFESVAAVTTCGYNLSAASEPVRMTCARVTDNLFPMLGVAPLRALGSTNPKTAMAPITSSSLVMTHGKRVLAATRVSLARSSVLTSFHIQVRTPELRSASPVCPRVSLLRSS
jgi:hypothetical protein